MLCVSSVMILAIIHESIPWCHLVVGILLLGFWTRDLPTYLVLLVFASSFRILVTFAIVLEVHGIAFFQIPWTPCGGSSLNQKIATRMLLMSPPFIVVNLPVLPLQHGLSGRNMLNLFGILIHASTTQKNICSFELSRFSCLPTLVYQLIVKSMRAIVHRCLLFLCSVKPFYPKMTRRNELQYLIHIQNWVIAVVLRRSKY